MNYSSDVQNTQNTENFSYTPYMIKPSTSNTSGYISYIDLLKFGQVDDFGYLQGYTSFSDWGGFIRSVHEHLQNLITRLNGETPQPTPQQIPVTGVTILSAPTELTSGQSGQVSWEVNPSNATNKSVTWLSSNTNYLTINNNGYYNCIGGTSEGANVTITITTQDGNYKATKTIKCKQQPEPDIIPVQSVSLDKTSVTLIKGNSTTLTATVYPANATNRNISWRPGSSSIASVSTTSSEFKCNVYGAAVGTTTVTVTTADGNKTASATIIVEESTPTPSSDYYWYIGVDNPTSMPTSNIQTDNTKPGWHKIGSSLNRFVHDMNNRANWIKIVTKANPTESDMIPYYVIVPNEVSITNALGTDLTSNGQLRPVECNISSYKAFVSTDRFITVKGLILKK